MTRGELEAIAWKLGVFKTVVATTPHPVELSEATATRSSVRSHNHQGNRSRLRSRAV